MIKLKNLLKEVDSETETKALEYLAYLKNEVKRLNTIADIRYRSVFDNATYSSVPILSTNPFERERVSQHDSNTAHQMALRDPEYQRLKSDALRAEDKLRKLEKRFKKTKKL